MAILIGMLLLSGCGGRQSLLAPIDDALDDNSTEQAATDLLDSDPRGPLPVPQIPSSLQALTPLARHSLDAYTEINYTVRCESPDAPELAEAFMNSSTLTRMQGTPLRSLTGLEQRLGASLQEGTSILHSFGFYEGEVNGAIELTNQPASASQSSGGSSSQSLDITVNISFTPGLQYGVGQTRISHSSQSTTGGKPQPASSADSLPAGTATDEILPANANGGALPSHDIPLAPPPPDPYSPDTLPRDIHPQDAPPLPITLADVGLKSGDPANAANILAAVDNVRATYRNSGYPNAEIRASRFFLRPETHCLDAEIVVAPGPFMRMGDITLSQAASVGLSYLAAKQTWKAGDPWNQDAIEAYRDSLRQTGLFVAIDLVPGAAEDISGNRPVMVTLTPAPERTLGGALKYDTSFGPGVLAHWEHRNLTGNGDSLRYELPVWMDMQEFSAKYRLPYFLRNDQDFIAQFAILNQDLDAYNLQAARLSAGIERQLSRFWKVAVQGSVEGGSLKDPGKPREEYMMFGMPLTFSFDSTNSLLNATSGGRAILDLAPYSGEYRQDFTVLRSRLDLQRFIPLVGTDTLMLALRGTVGTLSGASAREVPPSVRFYSGGGGSVRGYEFQSLGPRNYKDDPLGGSALTEVTIEPRWRFSENFGVVAFLDGGMAHDDVGDLGRDLRWGAGIGFRLFTAIGPVRFDVATPLTPRDDDEAVQFYISIGQSF